MASLGLVWWFVSDRHPDWDPTYEIMQRDPVPPQLRSLDIQPTDMNTLLDAFMDRVVILLDDPKYRGPAGASPTIPPLQIMVKDGDKWTTIEKPLNEPIRIWLEKRIKSPSTARRLPN